MRSHRARFSSVFHTSASSVDAYGGREKISRIHRSDFWHVKKYRARYLFNYRLKKYFPSAAARRGSRSNLQRVLCIVSQPRTELNTHNHFYSLTYYYVYLYILPIMNQIDDIFFVLNHMYIVTLQFILNSPHSILLS